MVSSGRGSGEAGGRSTPEQKQSQPCLRLDKKDFIQNRERRDRREIDETQQEQFNNMPYLPPSVHFRATHRRSEPRRVPFISGELGCGFML